MSDLIHTALHARHLELGARLAPFGGWEMPIDYGSTVAEHEAVRTSVGVFDVGHLGTVFVTGPQAADVIASSFTNDSTTLAESESQYTLCVDESGGILDDLIVYHLRGGTWMVVPNASNTATVVARLQAQAEGRDAEVTDRSRDHAILAVQGPKSLGLVSDVTGIAAGAVPYLNVWELTSAGRPGYICRTGYTGEVGCEIVVPNGVAVDLFDRLVNGGAAPVGLAARDTLRLEMGYPLHGNDIGSDTNPFEARLGWAVKLEAGEFVGRDALVDLKAAGPSRRLFGVRVKGRGIPRAGMAVTKDGVEVGSIRSGTFSPTLKEGIGLAYLADPIGPGDEVTVDIRGKDATFEVLRPPFVDRDPKG